MLTKSMAHVHTVYSFRKPSGEFGDFKITEACRDSYFPDCILLPATAEARVKPTMRDWEALLGDAIDDVLSVDHLGRCMEERLASGKCPTQVLTALGGKSRVMPKSAGYRPINLSAISSLVRQTIRIASAP